MMIIMAIIFIILSFEMSVITTGMLPMIDFSSNKHSNTLVDDGNDDMTRTMIFYCKFTFNILL